MHRIKVKFSSSWLTGKNKFILITGQSHLSLFMLTKTLLLSSQAACYLTFSGWKSPHRDSFVELMLMDAASAFHCLCVNWCYRKMGKGVIAHIWLLLLPMVQRFCNASLGNWLTGCAASRWYLKRPDGILFQYFIKVALSWEMLFHVCETPLGSVKSS